MKILALDELIRIGRTFKRIAAIYLRRSTDRQDQSIEDQKGVVIKQAEALGCDAVVFFIDDAVSGTSVEGRDDFRKMMNLALSPDPPFRHIITYDIKRFSRGDAVEAGYWLYRLRENGVRVVYATENFRGDDTDGLIWATKQWLARQESKDLSRVTFRGLISRVSEGW